MDPKHLSPSWVHEVLSVPVALPRVLDLEVLGVPEAVLRVLEAVIRLGVPEFLAF